MTPCPPSPQKTSTQKPLRSLAQSQKEDERSPICFHEANLRGDRANRYSVSVRPSGTSRQKLRNAGIVTGKPTTALLPWRLTTADRQGAGLSDDDEHRAREGTAGRPRRRRSGRIRQAKSLKNADVSSDKNVQATAIRRIQRGEITGRSR